jgi:hypothetical protein
MISVQFFEKSTKPAVSLAPSYNEEREVNESRMKAIDLTKYQCVAALYTGSNREV